MFITICTFLTKLRKERVFNMKKQKEEVKGNIELEDYSKVIEKYKLEIKAKPNDVNKRNMLAFAYYKQGMVDEAEQELLDLIVQSNNVMAYRQLIYIEKSQGDFESAKLWAYEALESYPDSIPLREQMISLAKVTKDIKEQEVQEKEINKMTLKAIKDPLKFKEKYKVEQER